MRQIALCLFVVVFCMGAECGEGTTQSETPAPPLGPAVVGALARQASVSPGGEDE